ncbi:MAG: ferrochelatase, partial [Rickettsiales bacterium]
VCCYPENPGFVSAVAERIKVALAETTGDGPLRILFSAHGLPKKVVDRGDPYKWAIEKTAAAVMTKIGESSLDWRVCYQSRVGPLEWIKPYTEDEIRQAGNEGTALIVVPIAFVSEHSETLVELDIEYRELAEESGVPGYRRVGTVSDDLSFIEGLCEIVLQAIARGPGLASETGTRSCPVSCGQCPVSG